MKLKKILSSFFIIAFVVCFISPEIVKADTFKASEQVLKNQEKALEYNRIVNEILHKNTIEKECQRYGYMRFIEEPVPEYAGKFIDDNGNLNINATIDAKLYSRKINISNIKYNTVRYSLRELNESYKILKDNAEKLKIKGIYIDVINNRIDITVSSLSNSILDVMNMYVDKGILNLRLDTSKFEYNMKPIISGTGFDLGSGLGGATIGAYAILNGKEGFLISGHCKRGGIEVGDSIKYKGVSVGTIRSLYLKESVDAGFVEVNSGDYYASKKLPGNKYYVNAAKEIERDSEAFNVPGLFVASYGEVTGVRYGKLISIDYSVTVEGTQHKEIILCEFDEPSQDGDSGGPLVYQRYVGSASTVPTLIGMLMGSKRNGKSIYSRSDKIFDYLGLDD